MYQKWTPDSYGIQLFKKIKWWPLQTRNNLQFFSIKGQKIMIFLKFYVGADKDYEVKTCSPRIMFDIFKINFPKKVLITKNQSKNSNKGNLCWAALKWYLFFYLLRYYVDLWLRWVICPFITLFSNYQNILN